MIRSFLNWSKPQAHEDVCVLLDIGNGSVGGSLVRFVRNKKPSIVYSVRYPIHIPDRPTSGHLLRKMAELLESVVKDLSTRGVRHMDWKTIEAKDIKHVFCIFSSPWYLSKTKVFKIERKLAGPVTEGMVTKLMEQEADGFMRSMVGNSDVDMRFIEQKVIKAKLNGYETHNPYNQVAKSIELTVFMSATPGVVLDRVNRIISRHFNARHIAHHSFALMSYSVVEDLFSSGITNYLFMDVTSEVTEITAVRRGIITDTLSLPSGKNLLMRKIADAYRVSPDIAATYVGLYLAGKAEAKLKRGIERAKEQAKAEWLASFDEAVAELSKGRHLSGKVFMTADEDVMPVFLEYMDGATHPVHDKREKFHVTPLNKNILAHFCTFGRGSHEDPFLAIESVYFNKIFHI